MVCLEDTYGDLESFCLHPPATEFANVLRQNPVFWRYIDKLFDR